MNNLFSIAFGLVSILLILVILLQNKNSSLGSLMGSDGGEEMAQTRRGTDKFLHKATIVLSILFIAGGLYWMIIQ